MNLDLFNSLDSNCQFLYVYTNFQQNSDIIYDYRLKLCDWFDVRECLDCILDSLSSDIVPGRTVVDEFLAESKWLSYCRDKKIDQISEG